VTAGEIKTVAWQRATLLDERTIHIYQDSGLGWLYSHSLMIRMKPHDDRIKKEESPHHTCSLVKALNSLLVDFSNLILNLTCFVIFASVIHHQPAGL
jgi:hypothetical protein